MADQNTQAQSSEALTSWDTCRVGSCHRHQDCMYRPCRNVNLASAPADDEGYLSRLLMDAQAACPPSYAETWVRCISPVLYARSRQLSTANAEIDVLRRKLDIAVKVADDITEKAVAQRDALLWRMADALRRVMTGGYSNMPQKAHREAHAALAAYDAMVGK